MVDLFNLPKLPLPYRWEGSCIVIQSELDGGVPVTEVVLILTPQNGDLVLRLLCAVGNEAFEAGVMHGFRRAHLAKQSTPTPES